MKEAFRHFARRVSDFVASPLASSLAAVLIVAWVASGPHFRFNDTWQLLMSTIGSLVTFFMVFIIANAQKRDTDALNLKLDMLIAADGNLNKLAVGIEHSSEAETAHVRREIKESIAEEREALRESIRENQD
jgi:low affinity Fe/Cu permease